MSSEITTIIISIVALSVGSILGYVTRQTLAKRRAETIESKLANLTNKAKSEAQQIILEAKNKAVKVLEETEKELKLKEERIISQEQKLDKKEDGLEIKFDELEKQKKDVQWKIKTLQEEKAKIESQKEKQLQELQRIAKLTQAEAKEELLSNIEKEYSQNLIERLKKLEREENQTLEKKARDIILVSIQKYAASCATETTTTAVTLPSDELKGRIIGKEGRNIKTLEKLTGVEVLVDDTPGAIVVSAFDPIRRQIAKTALEKLIKDGRIQPARIEEIVERARQEIGEEVQKAGEETVYEVGVAGLEPKLIKILGRLKFRTSYGQNVLLHSKEVAFLASGLAAELGLDETLAKKAGLLHDIGKAVDHEIQGSHVEIGKMILKKFNLPQEVILAMQTHHGEYSPELPEAVIVEAADAISGARPGARKDTLEAYLKRLQDIEKIASSFEGVEKSYAIQAGREIRIFVNPQAIDDLSAHKLARRIADRIQEDLKYPGEIKVCLIRETRVIEYAR